MHFNSKLKIVISFVVLTIMVCLGFTSVSFIMNNNTNKAMAAVNTNYQTNNENASKVYMTTDISPKGLMSVYKKLGFVPEGKVAVKLSTGEPPASNYLDPNLIKDLVQSVEGTIVECNTAYGGSRSSTAAHKQVAEDHGFTEIAKVDIMDEDGSLSIPVKNGKNIQENFVGSHLANYDSMITLSHFKGHAMAGFGGAIKNMSIGIGSREGKSWIHTAGSSKTSPWGGDQDKFLESMAEANSAVVDYMDGKIVYINVMNNISIDCDCDGNPSEPDMHDVGILASTDPVALDQACIDIVYNTDRTQSGTLINRIENRNGLHTLEYAEEIGLGSRTYNLVNIDSQEDSNISMTYENGILSINGLTDSASLIHASYRDNGELDDYEIINAINGEQDITAKKGDKFFLWENMISMRPLCKSITADTDSKVKGKTLVVYFSAQGHTKRIGDIIANYTNADVFEIEPKVPYSSADLNYGNQSSRVCLEHNDPNRHVELVSTNVKNFDSYDTVFIGYPIWWHAASWVLDDFVKENNFTGKTIIPFCTSASSGLEDSDKKLAEMAGTGNWLDGRNFFSGASESSVTSWIDGLNLQK